MILLPDDMMVAKVQICGECEEIRVLDQDDEVLEVDPGSDVAIPLEEPVRLVDLMRKRLKEGD